MDEEQRVIQHNLNVADYLPPRLKRQFINITGDYINKICKFMDKLQQEDIQESGARAEEFKEKIIAFSKRYVNEVLSYHMFETIPQLNEQFKSFQVIHQCTFILF